MACENWRRCEDEYDNGSSMKCSRSREGVLGKGFEVNGSLPFSAPVLMTLPSESTSTSGPVQVQSKKHLITMFVFVGWKYLMDEGFLR
jgi:hypothetical protein